jgi:hypothetical protein
MAGPKVQPPALFYSNRRVGLLQKIQYEITTNDGHEVVDAGTYFTDGVAQGKVSADLLVPVTGVGIPVTGDALLHKDVVLQLGVIDGKIHKLDARVEKITFDGEVANGKHTAKIDFMCKTPQVVNGI